MQNSDLADLRVLGFGLQVQVLGRGSHRPPSSIRWKPEAKSCRKIISLCTPQTLGPKTLSLNSSNGMGWRSVVWALFPLQFPVCTVCQVVFCIGIQIFLLPFGSIHCGNGFSNRALCVFPAFPLSKTLCPDVSLPLSLSLMSGPCKSENVKWLRVRMQKPKALKHEYFRILQSGKPEANPRAF